MNDFWNKRFSDTTYAYGEAPNTFLKQQLTNIKPGKILFPAEGEGRNAVFAATQGWQVTAFDPSTEGKKKAELLADKHNVKINYQIAGYENMEFSDNSFDCIVLIFAHMPSALRRVVHKKLLNYLKPGGVIILEGFSKQQINNNTGGPQSLDYLFSKEELQNDFDELKSLEISELERLLDEGPFHQGKASVVCLFGEK